MVNKETIETSDSFCGIGALFLYPAVIRFGCITFFPMVEMWNSWNYWHWFGAIFTFKFLIQRQDYKKPELGAVSKVTFGWVLSFLILWLVSLGI